MTSSTSACGSGSSSEISTRATVNEAAAVFLCATIVATTMVEWMVGVPAGIGALLQCTVDVVHQDTFFL